MRTPTVSVILPNYNHSAFLKERIDSIINQTYQDFELILLDDCSSDNSREILQSYAKHPRVSALVLNEKNTGNTFLQWDKGIHMAKGEYVWIAESDDCADSTFLDQCMDALLASPTASMCRTGSVLIDAEGKTLKRKSVDGWSESDDVKVFNGKEYIRHNLLYKNGVYNASMVVFKRQLYHSIDPSFQQFPCAGDWLFWIEIASLGEVIEIRKPLNYFRQHTNKVSSRASRSYKYAAESMNVLRHIYENIPLSTYQQTLVRGECYRRIKRSQLTKAERSSLYSEAYHSMGVTILHYGWYVINRFLSHVLPLSSLPASQIVIDTLENHFSFVDACFTSCRFIEYGLI